jgi:hypothetical protein
MGFEAAVGIGVFKLIMTFVSAYLVEDPNFGRRTLLLYGNTAVTISLCLLSYLYYGMCWLCVCFVTHCCILRCYVTMLLYGNNAVTISLCLLSYF